MDTVSQMTAISNLYQAFSQRLTKINSKRSRAQVLCGQRLSALLNEDRLARCSGATAPLGRNQQPKIKTGRPSLNHVHCSGHESFDLFVGSVKSTCCTCLPVPGTPR